MKNKKVIIYEIVTAVLALVSIFIVSIQFFNILIPENVLHTLIKIDDLIYVVFVIDYVTRLSLSKNKKDFIKNNKIDLISLIPFNAIFKSLRILKLNRLLKLGRLVKISVLFARFKDDSKLFFKTNHFGYVLITTIILIFLGAIAMSYLENMDIGDSIWWSFVTTTSVGYGDIYPTTNLGRIIAILLMITGLGFVGMLSGTIATYFLSEKKVKNSYRYTVIEDIKDKLDNFDDLSSDELDDICLVLKSLKSSEKID